MDVLSILVSTLASIIFQNLFQALSQRLGRESARTWLPERPTLLVIETALLRAIYEVIEVDAQHSLALLGWRDLSTAEQSELAQSFDPFVDGRMARKRLAVFWEKAPQDRTTTASLASLLVDEYRRRLSKEQVLRVIISNPVTLRQMLRHSSPSSVERTVEKVSRERRAALLNIATLWRHLDHRDQVAVAIRIDLDEALRGRKHPYIIYPGETAIPLVNGEPVTSPIEAGPLDRQRIEDLIRMLPPDKPLARSGGQPLREVVIFPTKKLDVSYVFPAKDRDKRQLDIRCTLRLEIYDLSSFLSGLLRGRNRYMLGELAKHFEDPVRRALTALVRERTFEQLQTESPHNYPATAIGHELGTRVYQLKDSGLQFLGIPVWELTEKETHSSVTLESSDDTCTDVSRASLWRFPPEESSQQLGPIRSRVALYNDSVYLADQPGNVYRLRVQTGEPWPPWNPCRVNGEVRADLLIETGLQGQSTLIVASTGSSDVSHLNVVDPLDGKVLHDYPVDGSVRGRLASAPLMVDGIAYQSCVALTAEHWGGVVGIRLVDGWKREWRSPKGNSAQGTPILVDSTLVFSIQNPLGASIFAADLRQPDEEATEVFKAERAVTASLVLDCARDCIYAVCDSGRVYALDLAQIRKGLVPKPAWIHELGKPIRAAGVLWQNRLHVGDTSGRLHALDLDKKGASSWNRPFQTQGSIDAPPVVHNGFVIVGSRMGHVYAVNASTGELFWHQAVEGELIASPFVSDDGVILVASSAGQQGFLYGFPGCFDGNDEGPYA